MCNNLKVRGSVKLLSFAGSLNINKRNLTITGSHVDSQDRKPWCAASPCRAESDMTEQHRQFQQPCIYFSWEPAGLLISSVSADEKRKGKGGSGPTPGKGARQGPGVGSPHLPQPIQKVQYPQGQTEASCVGKEETKQISP